MRTAKIIFAAWLILTAAASAFAQQGTGPGNFSNVTTPIVTLTPTNPVPTISSATVFPTVQGSTAYYYWIVVNNGTTYSLPSGPFVVPNGPASLSSKFYNVIQFTPLGSGYTYDILRTSTSAMPAGACNCAVAIGATAGVINDQSNSLSDYTVTLTQQNCVLTNGISGGQQGILSGCPFGANQSVYNVANFGTFANTKVSENVGVFNTPIAGCTSTPSGSCIYTTATNLFSQADVGKTIWVNGTGGGANRTPMSQGIITSVTVSGGTTAIATTSTSAQASCSPNAACYAVWGDDDTPAFTAAAAAAASGGTVYIPCGTYMITGPSFYQNGATYSLIGASEQCVTLIPSPNITSSSNIGTVIDFTASGNTLANLTVDGEEGLLPDEPIIQVGESASARSQLVSNIVIIDAATGGAAQFEAGGIYDTFTDVTSRDPNANSSGGMCDFVSPAGDVVINILCSNANAGYDNLEVNGASSPDTGSSILFQGGTIDECGENSGACTQIVNSQHVSFDHTIIWGSNAGGTGALSVDGTSEVNLDNGVWIGPYDGECGDGLTIASGGVVRMSHTTVVGNGATGCGGSNYAIDNGGTLYFNNGNIVTAQSGASQFTGNLPVFSTTQVGSVTAGHVAAWGSGGLGQLVDGGIPGQTVLATYSTTLSEDNALSANTVTSILTQAVTMPSSGCPCRADIRYTMYSQIDNQSLTAWVNDGTNSYAGSQTSTTSGAPSGQTGTQITGTYANSANVTFTLNAETSGASTTVKALSAQESLPTFLQITIYSSD